MAWCCQGSKTYYLDHSVFTSTRIGSWFFLVWITNRRRDIHKHRKHDNVIKWKHFPRYWPFVQGIHRSPVNSPASDTELWCFLWSAPWINGWVNNREAGDLRRHLAHYDVIVMFFYLRLNKRLSKQSWRRWFETPSRSSWRHCNGLCQVDKNYC